jgi:ankyrin repeat protein
MEATDEFRSTVESFEKILDFLSTGVTPILGATLVGDVELVKKLLAAGGDPNVGEPSKYGRALEVAARMGNAPMCLALIDGGAEVREKDLLAAITSGSVDSSAALLPFYVKKCGAGHGGTEVLYAAVESRNVKIATAVLDAPLGYLDKLNVTPAGKGHSPFGAAIAKDSPSIVKMLIERGADATSSIVDKGIRTPYLHYACMHAGAGVVRSLLDAGADVNAESDGEYPIHKVCVPCSSLPDLDRQAGVLQVLIDFGADITQKNKAGRTVMQMVARTDALREIVASAKAVHSVADSLPASAQQASAGARKAIGAAPL